MGGEVLVWAEKFKTRAKVKVSGGKEFDQNEQINVSGNYTFVIRNRSDISEKDLIVYDGIEYNIRFIKSQNDRDLYLEIITEKGVAQ